MTTPSDEWLYGGRYYRLITVSSISPSRDGVGLELDDVAPAPGRGMVMEAFRDDATGEWAVTSFVDGPLPLELVERFLAEARRNLSTA